MKEDEINTTIQNYGALNYWHVTHNDGAKSLGNMNTNGPQNVDSQFVLAMKGTSSTSGFLSYNGTNVTTSRFLLLTGANCNVGVSYPSSNQGVVWKSGSNPIYNRTYIGASETSQGYKFYTRGVRHNDYSYMTVYAYSFSYGYSVTVRMRWRKGGCPKTAQEQSRWHAPSERCIRSMLCCFADMLQHVLRVCET